MKWLILLTLVVVITPAAFAEIPETPQVIQTIGPNYDLTEDYFNGLATWQSHAPRIMFEGQWSDFAVIESDTSIQVASNSIGSLVYSKNNCSYSIYEAGYVSSDKRIIPSVSWMPRIAEVGTDNYSEMTDLFNQQCTVNVQQGEDWVKITSVKTQTEDLPPLVVQHLNGTSSTYSQGITQVATTTQTLDIRTDNGIKETVSVFNGNPEWSNHKFALTQTIHTGAEITLADQTYDVAAASGTVLDRQWIENNEAEIFEIADSLNYDMDVGFEQFNALQVIDDNGTYKVALDYSVNDATPYLSSYTVDPTFTTTGSGTFDITALHGGGTIVTGLIDGVTLTSGQISSLQSDINATNQYHTLAGTTLTVYYSTPTVPSTPANLSAVSGIPIALDWDASTDLGGAATGDMTYKVERSDYEFSESPLPINAGSDTAVNMSTNVLLYHLNEMATSPSNHIEDTSGANNDSEGLASTPTFSTGTIAQQIDDPLLTVKSTSLYDGTDSHTVGGWTSAVASATGTMLSFENTAGETISYEIESDKLRVAKSGESTDTPQSTSSVKRAEVAQPYGNSACTSTGNGGGANQVTSTDDIAYPHNQTPWGVCSHPSFEYDVTSISDSTTITKVEVIYTVDSTSHSDTLNWKQMSTQPSTYTGWQQLWNAIHDSGNNQYTTGSSGGVSTHTIDLGSTAVTDLQSALSNDWYAISPHLTQGLTLSGSSHTVAFSNVKLQVTSLSATNIIEATGQTISTSTPSHIQFNRGTSNDWSIYLDGASVATATDSTSLGTINTDDEYFIGQSPTGTNALPSLDEFYIFTSDKSGEASDIYDRGANQFAQVGSTTGSDTDHDDNSSLVSGTTYYHRIIANNGAFDSEPSNVTTSTAGTPPDAPSITSITIDNPNPSPLDITLAWQNGSSMGTGSFTNYIVTRSSDSTFTTSQNVGTPTAATITDTVPSAGMWYYKISTQSSHGGSANSAASNIATPTVPAAITDLGTNVISNVQIDLSWSAPNNGGSNIVQYKILRDSINVANTTSTSYSDSSLSDNTSYLFNVFAQNNVGTSTTSNSQSATTHTGVTGSISGTATTIGVTTKIDVTPNVTAGAPTPTFTTYTVKEGTTTIATFTGTTGYVHLTDDAAHTYTVESTDSTHWQSPTISGTISGVQGAYSPTWYNNAAYNYTRGGGVFDLTVNRDVVAGWNLDCEYRTSTQAAANQTGVHGVGSNMYAYQDQQTIADGKHVYITCMDGTTQVVSFTSYGPNLIAGGLNMLDGAFGDFLGAPAAILFVILIAGLFTGRTANTGILVVLALIGVLGFIGMIAIDETVWGFILIAGVLGLFVGRRFL